jgi:outer membrane lipoprotein-sorting protein
MKKILASVMMLALSCTTVYADSNSPFLPAPVVAQNKATIDRLQQYLSNLTTIISDFTQTAPDGTLTSGKFYLQRPGKMRWQYNPPTPILMVSNGSELVYYDYELEQSSHIPLDQTLIGFLAQDKINFSELVGITEFSQQPGAIRITLAQHEKPNDGQLMLEFSDQPLLLRNMVIHDSAKQVTTVSLNNARFGLKMDPELFIFREPGKKKRIH